MHVQTEWQEAAENCAHMSLARHEVHTYTHDTEHALPNRHAHQPMLCHVAIWTGWPSH